MNRKRSSGSLISNKRSFCGCCKGMDILNRCKYCTNKIPFPLYMIVWILFLGYTARPREGEAKVTRGVRQQKCCPWICFQRKYSERSHSKCRFLSFITAALYKKFAMKPFYQVVVFEQNSVLGIQPFPITYPLPFTDVPVNKLPPIVNS